MATYSEASVSPSFIAGSSLPESSSKQLLLDGYLRRDELAKQLGVSPRTIDRWQTLRCGPPRVQVGRTILYSLETVREWLKRQENSFDYSRNSKGRGKLYPGVMKKPSVKTA